MYFIVLDAVLWLLSNDVVRLLLMQEREHSSGDKSDYRCHYGIHTDKDKRSWV